MTSTIFPERQDCGSHWDWQCAQPSESVSEKVCQKARAERLLLQEIEFMSSSEFQKPGAADTILAPMPETPEHKKDRQTAPPGTPPYLADLYDIPLLTHEQEHHLFRQMNFLKYQAERLRRTIDPDRVNVGKLDQIEALLADALKVRNHIVQSNLRLVVSIAKKLVDKANSFDELLSEGNVPLLRAVEIFDFERGVRFSTYATWAVRNCLHRASPRNRRRYKRFVSGTETPFQSVSDHRHEPRGREEFHDDLQSALEEVMPVLSEREQQIVQARFGMGEEDRPQRYREIAEDLNISTERVRQLLVRSLERMREYAEAESIEFPDLDLSLN